MSRGRNSRIFDLYAQTYESARNSFSESRGNVIPFREMAPAQPQVQSQAAPAQNLPYNEQVDEDDEIPAMDHPSRHPAVQSAHAAFVVAHDALADDPTPENLEIFLDQVESLESALRTYVFGEQADEEGEDEDEEVDDSEEDDSEDEEADDSEDDDSEDEDSEDDDEEDAPAKDKFKKFQKRESSPYHKARAQSSGVETMNSPMTPSDLDIVYDSTLMDPWTIRYGQSNLANFSTQEEAQDAIELWMEQAQEPMPMDGLEEDYSEFLLPDPPENIDVSADSVMGGEYQDLRPPQVMGNRVTESFIIPYGSLGEVENYNPAPDSRSSRVVEASGPDDYFRKTSRSILDIESSYEEPEPEYNDPNFIRESREEIRLIDGEVRDSQCPSCAGLGCDCCESTGRVSENFASALQESINARNNQVSDAIGSSHFWNDKSNDVEFYGNFQPEPHEDPMVNAYDEIALARSRR